MPDVDYIVVGGGSAGCAVANRLSANPANEVLLIEAGQDHLPGEEPKNIRDTFYTAAYVRENLWPDTAVDWLSPISGEARRDPAFYEQARVMGGGSSVNAMIGLQGTPADFEEWGALGVDGWAWPDVQPYYQRLEHDLDFEDNNHGRTGPITVRRHARREWPAFVNAVASELDARGFRYIDDVNAGERDGYGRIPMTSLPTQRMSAAMGYLSKDVRRRKNLRVLSSTHACALTLSAQRVRGITVRRGDREESYTANEVVLSCGSYRTPALMMRSGLGPPAHLSTLGIDVRVALPGVGENLHDHPTFAAAAHLRLGATQLPTLRSHANAGLFYSSGVEDCPPLDMYMPIANKVSWHPVGERFGALFLVVMKPFSRGRVSLRSDDPFECPRIEVKAFDDHRDLLRAMKSMRLAHDILKQPAIKSLTTYQFGGSFSKRVSDLNAYNRMNWVKSAVGSVLLDGPAGLRDVLMRTLVCPNAQLDDLVADDARLESWLRDNVTGFFHPVGTCRMGAATDERAVVTSDGRVRGVEGLRIADASIMPTIVRATTNLTAIMIGEKIAQSILDSH
jgi:5-(hydroxymethyl)furfural/furfural oxidase